MLYFYYGEDSYRIKETTDVLKKKFEELYDPSGNNIESIDGETATLEELFQSLKAAGFLSPKKLVVIKNIFSNKNLSDLQDALISFLKTQKNTKDENYILFSQNSSPKKTGKLFKTLYTLCDKRCIKNFEVPSPEKQALWAIDEAKKYGKILSKPAAQQLVKKINGDTWRLHYEIHKLSHGTDQREIPDQLLERIPQDASKNSIFQLLDSLGDKNEPRALSLLEENFIERTEVAYMVAMLARHVRLLIEAKAISATSKNSYAISERLKLPPFIAKKMLAQANRFRLTELAQMHADVIELDSAYKRSPDTLRALLTLFVAQYARPTAS